MTTRQPMNQPRLGAGTTTPSDAWPRYLNAAVAIWLFISAFVWPHSQAVRTDTWIVAILVLAAAIWAIRTPMVRYANTVLAAWLFVSTIVVYTFASTVWNNLAVSVAVFVLSLIPSGTGTMNPTSPQTPART